MERTTESAMSSVGRVVEETHRVRDVAEVAIAKVKSVHSEVETKVATLAAQAKEITAHVIDALSKCISEVVVQSEAQTSHVVGTIAQQLGKGIEVAALSVAAMSEHYMCTTVDNLWREVQVQLSQNHVELEW